MKDESQFYWKFMWFFLIISAIFIIYIITYNNNLKSNSYKKPEINNIFKTGLYVSYFPDFSIELNDNGNVFITPKRNNTFFCTRQGQWTLNGEILTIEINNKNGDVYCDWVEDLEGNWRVDSNIIIKGNYKLINK